MNDLATPDVTVSVPHIIQGETVIGNDLEYGPAHARFTTPALDLNSLTWPRAEPGPAFDVPLAEIIDLLVATGERMAKDPDGLLAEACDQLAKVSTLERGILERSYATLGFPFTRASLMSMVNAELGGPEVLEGWKETVGASGQTGRVRAFPPRLIHILAGNAPGVAAVTIARGALCKGVHLLKLPSNDLFSATAILHTMAQVAPGHPVVRSFSAVYWRGGDAKVESYLMRPQYFDKLVAWGGERAIRGAKNYIGPGFELVAFDPKTSISFIGREVFASEETLKQVADWGALDATCFNQQACVSSRFQFIEGDVEDVDRYCELLQAGLGIERQTCSVYGPKVPGELREEIEVLGSFEPDYRVWGGYDGKGLVIRSHEPVDFYPDGKIVNVVMVPSLKEAIRYVNVATQTVGVYPPERKREVRDLLASGGVQRVVSLGKASGPGAGFSHDGFWPLHRFVRWVNDED